MDLSGPTPLYRTSANYGRGENVDPIVITGMGVVTSIGSNIHDFWHNLLLGKQGTRDITSFDVSQHVTKRGCEVDHVFAYSGYGGEGIGKATAMYLSAAEDAMYQAKLSEVEKVRVGICVGTTMGESDPVLKGGYRQCPHAISDQVADLLSLNGPRWTITNACAAGNFAMAQAMDELRAGNADCMIAGGVDALSWTAFTGFGSLRAMSNDWCRPFDANRKGLILGEGAGVLVLERESDARARGAAPLAYLLGYGLTCDAYHITQPDPSAVGAMRSMLEALRMAGLTLEDIGYVSAHGTGTPANDRTEAKALADLFGEHMLTSSIKGHIGHTLGAASAIEAIASVNMLSYGWLPHTLNLEQLDPECRVRVIANQPLRKKTRYILSNAYAFGGINSSIVLGKAGST
nr:beta-ketoacyl-[acyl-carrier-protein] synthase family protein [Paenibacillus dendritiformis]